MIVVQASRLHMIVVQASRLHSAAGTAAPQNPKVVFGQPLMPDQRFRPQYRIRRSGDFQRAYRRRCSAADQRLIVFGHRNDLPYPRLGLSVSRRLGGAVVRNRWKRLLREAFRQTVSRLPAGVDLIVIPKSDPAPELAALMESLLRLADRVAKHK